MTSTALLKTKYKKYNSPEYYDNIISSPTFLRLQNKDKTYSLARSQNTASITTSTSSQICKICNTEKPAVTDLESGEIICKNCGAVILDKIEESDHDWFTFSSEEVNNKTRTGAPTSLARHDGGYILL